MQRSVQPLSWCQPWGTAWTFCESTVRAFCADGFTFSPLFCCIPSCVQIGFCVVHVCARVCVRKQNENSSSLDVHQLFGVLEVRFVWWKALKSVTVYIWNWEGIWRAGVYVSECVCQSVCQCVQRLGERERVREREMSQFPQIKLDKVSDAPQSVCQCIPSVSVCTGAWDTRTHLLPPLLSPSLLLLVQKRVLFCWSNIGIHITTHTHLRDYHISQSPLLVDLAPLRYVCCLNWFHTLSIWIAPHRGLILKCLFVISARSSVWQPLFG